MQFYVEAILFDIDGTLVDSTGAVVRTWQAWAANRDIEIEDILRVCHGRRTADTVALFVPAEQRAAAVAELERLELADLAEVVALPATRTLLRDLPADRWAAVTSGSQALMRARLTAAGLPVPDVLISADDVNARKARPGGVSQSSCRAWLRHRSLPGCRGRSRRHSSRPRRWRTCPCRGHVAQRR